MSSSTQRAVTFAVVVVLLIAGFGYGYVISRPRAQSPVPPVNKQNTVAETASSAAIRAELATDDPLRAVGSEWSFYRIDDLSKELKEGDVSLQGIKQQRRALITLNGKQVLFGLTEYGLEDAQVLTTSLKARASSTQVAGRDGYVVPVGGLVPSSGFVLVGAHSVFILQYGGNQSGPYMDWPTTLEPEIERLISQLNLR